MSRWMTAAALSLFAALTATAADEPTPAQRGEKALLGRHFTPPTIPVFAYQNLWKAWGLKEPPKNLNQAVIERYGLHAAPFENNGYPLGLREVSTLFGKSLTVDCMVCHGGSINGKSYVGLGNSTFDYQGLLEDTGVALGLPEQMRRLPFTVTNTRGTVEAGAMSVFLIARRNSDLTMRGEPLDLKLRDDLCEDTPAWWLLKKKRTMYHTGGGDARSVRSIMQFMMSPPTTRAVFEKEEATFRDIQAYLLTLEAPKYPWPIDAALAAKGQPVFVQNCARCHGSYGEKPSYPNKVIPLKEIGTDPARFHGVSPEFGRHYNTTWFAQEEPGWFLDGRKGIFTDGYQAPPLDGVWATAPYFHNGSAPTVHDVLSSKGRPKVFTRSFKTGEEDFDKDKLGWKVRPPDTAEIEKATPFERRKVYDTTKPGRSNGGHAYGDDLSDDERRAVIEYLKTL